MNWEISDFQDPVWKDPNTFLLEHKDKFGSLQEFANSLNSYSEKLKNQLTNIIHQDYTEFVTISKQLLQLGELMNSLIKDLTNAENTIDKAAKTLQQNLQPLKAHSEKLHKVRKDAAINQLALDAIQNLQNIENQLKTSDSSIYSFLDASIGLAVVKAKISGIDQPALSLPITKEFDRLSSVFNEKLANSFVKTVSERNREDLGVIFNAAILSNFDKKLYEVFQTAFLKPTIEKEFPKVLEKNKANSHIILPKLQSIIEDENGFVQLVISKSPPIFDFAANSIWPFLGQWLFRTIIFPIGSITEMHDAYNMWMHFVNTVEKLCKSKKAIKTIRKSQVMEHISSNKLKIGLYPQLVTIEITSHLSKIYQEPVSIAPEPYFLSPMEQIINEIKNCFTEPYFIPEKAQDYVILTMKIIISYCDFVRQQKQNKAYIVLSMRKLSSFIRNEIPKDYQPALEIAANYIDQEAQSIEDIIVNKVLDDTLQRMEYIQSILLPIDSKMPTERSVLAPDVFKPYRNWIENKKNPLNSQKIAEKVVDKVFEKFDELSHSVINTQRSRNQSIMKYNNNANIDPKNKVIRLKKQLLLDLQCYVDIAKTFGVDATANSRYETIYNYLNEEETD